MDVQWIDVVLVNSGVVSVKVEGILDSAVQEITGNLSDNGENSAKDPIMRVEALKAEKRRLKRR